MKNHFAGAAGQAWTNRMNASASNLNTHTKLARLDVVDGLRGIAILIVIYQHTFATTFSLFYKKITGFDYPYVILNGWMGVSFFFVLSGFVLFLPYLTKKRDITSNNGIRDYYINRAKRLLPLFLFMAFVSMAFISKSQNGVLNSLFMTISMSSMFSTTYFFPKINPAFWSLMIEISFSALLPAILISINKFGIRKTAVTVFLLALLLRIAGTYFEFGMIQINPVKDFVIARCDDFMAGMVICYLYVHGRLPEKPITLTTVGIALIISSALVWDFKTLGHFPNFILAFTNNLTSLGFCLILAAALTSKGLLSRLLSMWWLRIIGAMCFSIYCWHLLLISDFIINEPTKLKVQFQFWLTLFVLSAVTFRYIECFHEKSLRKVFMIPVNADSKLNNIFSSLLRKPS